MDLRSRIQDNEIGHVRAHLQGEHHFKPKSLIYKDKSGFLTLKSRIQVFHILAKIEPRTLVLFDEPELHLHPQLLTGLLSALAEILVSQDSFAIIATHSPLVIQQLPKECVHVIRRDRMTPMVVKPTFQTFGENISDITRFVFASTEADRDYRGVLDGMFAEENGDIDKVRQLFGGQLSLNADIYLESLRERSELSQ